MFTLWAENIASSINNALFSELNELKLIQWVSRAKCFRQSEILVNLEFQHCYLLLENIWKNNIIQCMQLYIWAKCILLFPLSDSIAVIHSRI